MHLNTLINSESMCTNAKPHTHTKTFMVKSYLSTVIVKLLENHSKENCFMKIKEDIIINVKVKYHEMFAVCGLYFNIVWHLFYLLYSSSCCIEFTKSRSIYCLNYTHRQLQYLSHLIRTQYKFTMAFFLIWCITALKSLVATGFVRRQ